MTEHDPFLIAPELWFAVLCEGVRFDQRKRIDLRRVFSRLSIGQPPGWDLGPFAHLRAVLAVGYSYGVGEFSADISLQDVDGHVLWNRPKPWVFRVGPGDSTGVVLAEPVEYVFREPGNYYFVLRLTPPGSAEHRVRLEVALPEASSSPEPPFAAPDQPQ